MVSEHAYLANNRAWRQLPLLVLMEGLTHTHYGITVHRVLNHRFPLGVPPRI